jgi:hypothetical protein
MGERGAMTEGDVGRIAGMSGTFSIDQRSSLSLKDQLNNWIETKWDGGLSVDQREALLEMLDNLERQADDKMATAAKNLEDQASDPETNPRVAKGIRDWSKAFIPTDIRERVKTERAGSASPATGAGSEDFDKALNEQAEAEGLDPAKVRAVIGKEGASGPKGDSAKNPRSSATGRLQFLESTAKSMGTSTEALAKMSGAEQVPYIVKYLKRTGKLNEKSTQADYYMAVAAPGFIGKPDASVVYKKDSDEWRDNPAWRPKDGGDITVGSIKAYGGGKAASKSTSRASRARELLKEGGYL